MPYIKNLEKFIVLDVEGKSNQKPYDIGYIVADRYGHIYLKRSFFLSDNFIENYITVDFDYNSVQRILNNSYIEFINDSNKKDSLKKYKRVSKKEFIQYFIEDCKKYDCKKFYAYNVSFDKRMIAKIFGNKEQNFYNGFQFMDIAPIIANARLLTKRYLDFCLDWDLLTKTNWASTKAETVYGYLLRNPLFSERHTGLEDTLIEYEILMKAFESKKKIVPSGSPFYLLKKFAIELNHSIATDLNHKKEL